jgi:hypothetical protein
MRLRLAESGWGSILVGAGIATGATFAAGCVTAPPPELSSSPPRRPTIRQDLVQPAADQILFYWPPDGSFSVPVELGEPRSDGAQWAVFVDYDPFNNPNQVDASGAGTTIPGGSVVDAGIFTVAFTLSPPAPTSCHRIEFLVAHKFAQPHMPDSIGGDQVTWFYMPPGLGECSSYDAGTDSQVGPISVPVDGSGP